MKIAIACQSVLLEKSLSIFLKKYLTSYKACDFVISDSCIEVNKPIFLLSADNEGDLALPFTKSSLILALERFYAEHILASSSEKRTKKDFQQLVVKIDELTDDFRQKLITTIKEFYE